MDGKLSAMYAGGDEAGAVQAATEYCVGAGEQMTRDWRMFLFR